MATMNSKHAEGEMVLTLADVLKLEILSQAQVLTAKKNLGKEVTSVTVGEVPDIADWLSGGELVLSTFFATSKSLKDRLHFVKRIIEKQAAALLIKPARFLKSLDKQIVTIAEEANFPLIKVPVEVRWTDIIKETYEKIVSLETEIRFKGDFVDDLIFDQFKSDKTLLARARFLSTDLSQGTLVMMVDIDNFADFLSRRSLSEEEIQKLKRAFFDYVSQIVHSSLPQSFLSLKGETIIIFLTPTPKILPKELPLKAERLAQGIQEGSGDHFEFTVSLSLSRFYPKPSQVKKAYEEAKVALEISQKLGEKKKIVTFDDVGTYKLLVNLLRKAPQDLKIFYEETVASLEDYDKLKDAEFLKTLETFLKHNQNINQTAASLYSHRHTVRYRLQRIKEITGLNPFKIEDLERLSLGLKAKRLLHP